MDSKETYDECITCGKIEINNYWYRPGRTPPHVACYHGAICPECRIKKETSMEIIAKNVKPV